MKILAISNIRGAAEKIADIFESSDASIIAREENSDITDIRDKISAAFSKGVYDYTVVVVDDYISATAMLNKVEEISAAVFDSEDDMGLLSGSKINTLIIKASRKNPAFLDMLLGTHAHSGKMAEVPQKPKVEKPVEKKNHGHRWLPINISGGSKKDTEKSKHSEEDDKPKMTGRKGIVGKLKDNLGIIDE